MKKLSYTKGHRNKYAEYTRIITKQKKKQLDKGQTKSNKYNKNGYKIMLGVLWGI